MPSTSILSNATEDDLSVLADALRLFIRDSKTRSLSDRECFEARSKRFKDAVATNRDARAARAYRLLASVKEFSGE